MILSYYTIPRVGLPMSVWDDTGVVIHYIYIYIYTYISITNRFPFSNSPFLLDTVISSRV